MLKNDELYQEIITLLKNELVPAMGCTEPIALALAAATAREALGTLPSMVHVAISGNIMKNANSVVIPNTNGLKGIKAAIAAGVVAGNASKKLEVLASVSDDETKEIASYLKKDTIEVELAKNDHKFFIEVICESKEDKAIVQIVHGHTNIVLIKVNDRVLFEKDIEIEEEQDEDEGVILRFDTIMNFMDVLDYNDIEEIISRQATMNMSIAKEGNLTSYGSKVGKTILGFDNHSIKDKAIAMAASASDARMNGCEMPVIILSGSGNQGITASLPIVVYYEAYKERLTYENFIKGIALSDLLTLYQKQNIGKLSPLCGVVHAGLSSVAGIAYMFQENKEVIRHIIVNGLGTVLGIMCDGAKSSCAAKIAMSIHAGFLGYELHQNCGDYQKGDGIVTDDIDEMMVRVGKIANEGMSTLDQEVLEMMKSSCN